ncbi:MAG: TonB family protein [Phenylobacterium sp.]|uniref:TonB family protein n=1 Tax=Phenylobacterium sp. TaxID=1871053 RepID=UPI0025D30171|nr:TonB family protein [Phenylobacterium sp.]MBI1199732.1 TonB family protein [Phenylobacterium sp.]
MKQDFVRAALGIAVAAAGFAGSASGAERESDWARIPSDTEWRAAWPKAAKDAGVGGRVVMRCHVEDAGDLSGCAVVSESPSGMGFGQAMLGLAPAMKRKPPGAEAAREIMVPGDWYEFDKRPDWLRRPSPNDLLTVYPKEAFHRGTSGRAVINCIVTVQGALRDCVAISETPAGAHFGDSAIALTPQFTMKPATRKGVPVLSVVSIPVNFAMPGGMGGSAPSKTVVPPDLPWVEAPTFADVAAAYPEKARKDRRGGHATLSCAMREDGRLNGCSVIASEPRGYGFDKAAKSLSKLFRFEVSTPKDRKATHSIVLQMPITFDPKMIDGEEPVVGKPHWSRMPNAEQMRAVLPNADGTMAGRAVIRCVVQPRGVVGECKVLSEEPEGAGLGQAALALAPTFGLTTWTAEGLPVVGGFVSIPLRFQPAPPPAGGH